MAPSHSQAVANVLEKVAPEILRQWEAKARISVPAARRESTHVLRNSIPMFLEELARALAGSSDCDASGPVAPREHALQRFNLKEYSLEQVILEYSLLRTVLLDVVEAHCTLSSDDRRVILDMIDCGVSEASSYFVELQEAALRESEERFRVLVANVKDYAIYMLDPEGYVVTWNHGAENIKGYTAEEIIGRHFSEFYIEQDVRDEKPERGLREASTVGQYRDEGLRVRKDGSTFFADVSITALKDDACDLRGFAKVTRDITDRKRMEVELHQQAQQLLDANRRKDEFLAMLAHELRNPLASIVTSAEIQRFYETENTVIGQARDVILRQSKHLARLVDDLLDVARLEQNKITLQKAPLELKQLVDQVAETLRPFIEDRRQVLAISLPETAIWLEADFVRLSQVLSNLVHNSAKFTEPGGHIDLRVWLEAQEVIVQVRDNGAGIDSDFLPHIFDAFSQGEPGKSGGLGVGLALSQRLVQMHGGVIGVHSDGRGHGSRFTVRLPVLHSETPTQEPPDAAARALERGDQVPRKILVVDDNVDAANGLAVLLGFLGHSVITAHSGHEAMQVAGLEQPEILILDIGLPDMSGYELVGRLRQLPLPQNSVVIALTGYGQAQDKLDALRAGFDAHLTKPADLATLRNILLDAGGTTLGSGRGSS